MTTLPHGSWPSPITVDLMTSGSVGLGAGTADGDALYWTESYADQGGRTSLWREDADGVRTELTPEHNVRTGVHEYGGGAWDVAEGVIVYSAFPSHEVYVLEPGAGPRRIAAGQPMRYAALRVVPGRRLALAVREDHTHSDIDCVNTLVALDLDSDNPDGGRLLASGADFYAGPVLSDDGRLAWCEWDHPDMPWDASRVVVAPLSAPTLRTVVAADAGVSAAHPGWSGHDLVFLSDASGFWNFRRWDGREHAPLHEHPYDFCAPQWTLDAAPYALLPDGRIGCSWQVDGADRIGVLDDGALHPLQTDAVAGTATAGAPRTPVVLGFPDRPAELHVLDWDAGTTRLVRRSSEVEVDPAHVSVAQERTWDGPDGPVHAWWYPPTNPDAAAPAGELPPVHVLSHGGPTSFSPAAFNLGVQYWTSRGYGVLDVNYGGSSGYGRAYRDRLRGQWGVVDVRDCCDGARSLVEDGLADPDRLVIRGGSAGGYTTLRALTTTDMFAAGISLFGIGDLEAIARDSHKFESRYELGLVGPYPGARELYVERSPVHHLDRLSCPVLILQGSDDRVVPPNQAHLMADAARAKGLPVALVIYEGEGHGFRRADTIRHWLEASQSFLGQVFGFTPADDVPRLEVENLR